MKQRIFSNWNLMRFLRLVLGIAIITQSILINDIWLLMISMVFTAMPIFNIGCCGASTCYHTPTKTSKKTTDIKYEEVV